MKCSVTPVVLVAAGLTACAGGPSDPGRNGLSLDLRANPGVGVSTLAVFADSALFAGEGPDGPESVTTEINQEIGLLGGAGGGEDLGWELSLGAWDPASVQVVFASRGSTPALYAAGLVADDDDDDDAVPFVFRVEPSLTLAGSGSFVLEGGVDPHVVFELNPGFWFDGVDPDDLEVGDDGVITISPATNAAAYQVMLERLGATTIVRFPGTSP